MVGTWDHAVSGRKSVINWPAPASLCIVQELCESWGGRLGLSILTSLLVSVDVEIYWTVLRHWSQLVPNMTSEDIKQHFIHPSIQPCYSTCVQKGYSMLLLLTSRAYLWTRSSILLTRLAHQESKLLIWLHLSAQLVNRDKLSRVKVCAPKTWPYKSRIKTEITCLTVYTITPMH